MFVDKAKITVKSGKGGNGCVSFRREPFVPDGGPDGGDGGKGGDIIIQADSSLHTLMDFKYKKKYEAESGQDGMRRKCFGKYGQDLIIKVPEGTLIIDEISGTLMKDLKKVGMSFVVAKGGKGGKGNVHFKNSIRQAPNFAEAGERAVERKLVLELKLIADVGLVGFPNAGKSTFLAASTRAKPKIADYPFTTITPNLGVVEIFDNSFVLADIAGIIEDAHKGAGLGHEFLKHIERTKLLIHVVDISALDGSDPLDAFWKVNAELALFDETLGQKHQIVVASKADLIDLEAEHALNFKATLEKEGYKVFFVSAVTGLGFKEVLAEAYHLLGEITEEELKYEDFDFEEENRTKSQEYRQVQVTKEGELFLLSGGQLEKIFDSTNFNDAGSIRYLYKYIEKSGALDKLKELGLEDGQTIRIKDFEFEYMDEY